MIGLSMITPYVFWSWIGISVLLLLGFSSALDRRNPFLIASALITSTAAVGYRVEVAHAWIFESKTWIAALLCVVVSPIAIAFLVRGSFALPFLAAVRRRVAAYPPFVGCLLNAMVAAWIGSALAAHHFHPRFTRWVQEEADRTGRSAMAAILPTVPKPPPGKAAIILYCPTGSTSILFTSRIDRVTAKNAMHPVVSIPVGGKFQYETAPGVVVLRSDDRSPLSLSRKTEITFFVNADTITFVRLTKEGGLMQAAYVPMEVQKYVDLTEWKTLTWVDASGNRRPATIQKERE